MTAVVLSAVLVWVAAGPSVKEGDVMIVTCEDPAGAGFGLAYGFGVQAPLWPSPEVPGVLTGLLPVPVGTKGGLADIRCTAGETPPTLIGVHVVSLPTLTMSLKVAALNPKTQKSLKQEGASLAMVFQRITPRRFWEGAFILPYDGRLTEAFGVPRTYNRGASQGRHWGVDLAPQGESRVIRAANTGVVAAARGYEAHGNTVVLDHGFGLYTMYLHLKQFTVNEGQPVLKGAPIGVMGATGLAEGVHLHWGARYRAIAVNPLSLLALP